MKIDNTTNFPVWLIKGVIRHCQVPGSNVHKTIFTIVDNGKSDVQGSVTRDGRSVIIRIAPGDFNERFWLPVNWKKMGYIEIYSRLELLVYCIAHELRHLWQHHQINRSQYYPKARGKYSEVDAECWALNRVRLWRREIFFKGRSVKKQILCEKCVVSTIVSPGFTQCHTCYTTKEIICPKCERQVTVYYKHTMCSECFFVYQTMDQYKPPDRKIDHNKRISTEANDAMGFYAYARKILEDK